MGTEGAYMVVGLDGSAGSARSLDWAMARVERFGPIQPVSAWRYPWWSVAPFATTAVLPPAEATLQEHIRQVADRMLERVPAADRLTPLTTRGPAGSCLVDAAAEASLLVVGSRGHGAVAGNVLGSVGQYCASHAHCPVAVVPLEAELQDRFRRVVVGIDGTQNSRAAVDWALVHTPPETQIDLIHVWDPEAGTSGAPPALARERLEELAEGVVAKTVSSVASMRPSLVEGHAYSGDARAVLRSAGEGADLVIVGAGQHNTVGWLGSVAAGVVGRPETTTIVIRGGSGTD